MNHDELISAAEAADMLPETSADTLRRWARKGQIAAVVLPSGRIYFQRAEIESLLEPILPTPVEGVPVQRPVSGVDADPLVDPGQQSLLAELDRVLA